MNTKKECFSKCDFEEKLNRFAAQGWEFVTIIEETLCGYILLLRRSKED